MLPPFLAAVLLLTGCCVSTTTRVRNETGQDIQLTVIRNSKPTENITIPSASAARCVGVVPVLPGGQPDAWVISDGHARFTFADVTPIASLPGQFTSRSRFTRDFPCKRVTRHVRLAPDMTIHALRVIGYTAAQPSPFPLRYTSKEVE